MTELKPDPCKDLYDEMTRVEQRLAELMPPATEPLDDRPTPEPRHLSREEQGELTSLVERLPVARAAYYNCRRQSL